MSGWNRPKGPGPDFEPEQEQPARSVPCSRCDGWGVIPFWAFVEVDDEETVEARSGRCSCVNGARFFRLPDIDSVPGLPRGLTHHQMNQVLTALIAHPGMLPLEAIGYIPKSREEMSALFARVSPKLAREVSSRFCPDATLLKSWKEIRDALLACQEHEPNDLPF